jgi:hypothetical protein
MENISLPSVINESLARFSRNRIGSQPRVFVTVSPDFPEVPWWGVSKNSRACFSTNPC